MRTPQLHRGFGLWQALMILLIVSGMMLLALKYARISVEHTADTYVREQLELYAGSVMEMSLLEISLRNKTNCLKDYTPPSLTKKGVTYAANVEVVRYYLLRGVNEFGSCSVPISLIESSESHGMAVLQIEATATSEGSVTHRILRRSLQRP